MPIENPWTKLPAAKPFVLDEDREWIEEHDRSASDRFRIRTELIPEPFLGDIDAPVVLLNLNPGFSEYDLRWHSDAKFVAASRGNLVHAQSEYPFYLLDPVFEEPSRLRWWTRKLSALIAVTDRRTVAQAVLCVEYFPYHSFRYRHRSVRVPSQRYSEWLVRSAVVRGAIIVLLRSERFWFDLIPELMKYDRLFPLRNPQNPTVSPGNMDRGYSDILAALRKTGSRSS